MVIGESVDVEPVDSSLCGIVEEVEYTGHVKVIPGLEVSLEVFVHSMIADFSLENLSELELDRFCQERSSRSISTRVSSLRHRVQGRRSGAHSQPLKLLKTQPPIFIFIVLRNQISSVLQGTVDSLSSAEIRDVLIRDISI